MARCYICDFATDFLTEDSYDQSSERPTRVSYDPTTQTFICNVCERESRDTSELEDLVLDTRS